MYTGSSNETFPIADEERFDVAAVEHFLRSRIACPAAPLEAAQFRTGNSNLTFLLRMGEREWVLRRPPLGPLLATAHDMKREYRVLEGLARTDVPAPRPVALCEDPALIGAPFYVMERARGFVVVSGQEPELTSPGARRAMSFGLVDALAALHTADYAAAGLADFGKPEGFIGRQIERWRKQWLAARTRDLPAADRLDAWLRANAPASSRSGIVHGDASARNTIFDSQNPGRVVALLDWEMATLGDPLCDLGYLVALWPEEGDTDARRRVTPEGLRAPDLPRRAELTEHYARATGWSVADLRFYEVLALYKMTVILEGIYSRYVKGQTHDERFAQHGARVEWTAEAACEATGL